MWRVTWHDGRAYGVSYNGGQRGKAAHGPADWKLKLFVSDDGLKYTSSLTSTCPADPNETTLRFLPDGEMIALVRREAGDRLRLDRAQPASVHDVELDRDEAPAGRAELPPPPRRVALGRRPRPHPAVKTVRGPHDAQTATSPS